MSDAESKVRAVWKRVTYSETGLTPAGPCYVVISNDDHPTAGSTLFMEHGSSKEAVFAAALAFTEQRLREIAEVEEELEEIAAEMSTWDREYPAWNRILAREQAALAELKRGMKAEATQ